MTASREAVPARPGLRPQRRPDSAPVASTAGAAFDHELKRAQLLFNLAQRFSEGPHPAGPGREASGVSAHAAASLSRIMAHMGEKGQPLAGRDAASDPRWAAAAAGLAAGETGPEGEAAALKRILMLTEVEPWAFPPTLRHGVCAASRRYGPETAVRLFIQALARMAGDQDPKRFFQALVREFQEDKQSGARQLDFQELYERISEMLLRDKAPAVSELLRGLTEQEVLTLMCCSRRLRTRAKSAVILQGDRSRDIYLVMDGLYEVRVINENRPLGLRVFGRGEVFGELAYCLDAPRSADVTSLSDGELIVFENDKLGELQDVNPGLMARVANNLLRIVSGRLVAMNQSVLDLAQPRN
jgi:CRP-like cAMP-binding protein